MRSIPLLLLLAGCGQCGLGPGDSGLPAFPGDWSPPAGFWSYEGPERLIVAETDFEVGVYSVLDPATGAWVSQGGSTHSDAVTACAGSWLLLINRYFGDNLQFVDPATGATVAQYSTGNGTNPNAVVFHGERAFVSLYEVDYLLVLRWDTGEELGRVDLSPWADDDGVPEASQLFVADDRIWLTLQRMDREAAWVPADSGLLLGIDPGSLEVVQEIDLQLGNPSGSWNVVESVATVSALGAYQDEDELPILDGGLLRVDLNAGSVELLDLDEASVGANIYDALVYGDDAWLNIYGASLEPLVEHWNVADLQQRAELLEGYTSGWTWAGGAGGQVWVARHTDAAVELRSWPGGELQGSQATALHPAALSSCSP